MKEKDESKMSLKDLTIGMHSATFCIALSKKVLF